MRPLLDNNSDIWTGVPTYSRKQFNKIQKREFKINYKYSNVNKIDSGCVSHIYLYFIMVIAHLILMIECRT